MFRKLFLVCMVLSFLFTTGCNNPQFLGLLKTGGLLALLNDDHGNSSAVNGASKKYAVDGYFGIVDESVNGAPSLLTIKRTSSNPDQIKIVITPEAQQAGSEKTIFVDNNHFSLGDLPYKPGKMLAYKGNTLLGEIKIDNGNTESESGADVVTYRVKLLIRRKNNIVTKIEYGALKVIEKKDIVERCYIAASNNGDKIDEKEMEFSEIKKISNVNEENKNSVRKRIISEYQQLLANTIDSIKNVLNDELNELLIEVNALKETKKQLEAAKDTSGLENDTLTNLISVEDALDTDLTFVYSGNSNWYTTLYETYNSVAALTSGIIGDGEKSVLETTVQGPGRISFLWKTISELNYDYLTFYIDNTEMAKISGETSWEEKMFLLAEGSHNLKWIYSKDGKGRFDRDCGFLQDIHFTEGEFSNYIKNIKVLNISQNSANILWDSLGVDVKYNVYLNEEKINDDLISENTYNLTDLIRENDYFISIEPVYEDETKGPLSERILFSTTNGISVREALDIELHPEIAIEYLEEYVKTQNKVTYDNTDALTLLPLVSTSSPIFSANKSIGLQSDSNLTFTVKGPGKLSFMWKLNSEDVELMMICDSENNYYTASPKYISYRPSYNNLIYGNTDWIKYELIIPEGLNTYSITCKPKNIVNNYNTYSKNNDERFTGQNAGYIDNFTFESGLIPNTPRIDSIFDVTDNSFSFYVPYRKSPIKNGSLMEIPDINVYINGELNKTVSVDESLITVDGLNPDSEYSLQISSVYNGIESFLSEKVLIYTTPIGVSFLDALDIKDTSVVTDIYFSGDTWRVVKNENAVGGYCVKSPNPSINRSEMYIEFIDSGMITYNTLNNVYLEDWKEVKDYDDYFSEIVSEMIENSGHYELIDNMSFVQGCYPSSPDCLEYFMLSEQNYKIKWSNDLDSSYTLYLNDNVVFENQNIGEYDLNLTDFDTINEIKVTAISDYTGAESLPSTIYIKTLPENISLNDNLTLSTGLDVKINGTDYYEFIDDSGEYAIRTSFKEIDKDKEFEIRLSFTGPGTFSFDMLSKIGNMIYGEIEFASSNGSYTEKLLKTSASYPYTNYSYEITGNEINTFIIRVEGLNLESDSDYFAEFKNFKFVPAE